MTNSRRKGAAYELEVDKYFTARLEDLWTRTNRNGYDGDDGDIGGLISVECKNQKAMNLAGWLDQAWDQTEATARLPVVVHKRPRVRRVGDHYVTMDVDTFLLLVKKALT